MAPKVAKAAILCCQNKKWR